MSRKHQTLAATVSLALALTFVSTSAEAGAWRSFGYPAQHTDLISARSADGNAAFNLHCLPGDNLVMVQMRNGPSSGKTTLMLSVDGRVVARHAAGTSNLGGVSMIEFGGPGTNDATIARWLDGIASAGSDVAISAGRSVAHFSADGARSAATTALSYCKFQ